MVGKRKKKEKKIEGEGWNTGKECDSEGVRERTGRECEGANMEGV